MSILSISIISFVEQALNILIILVVIPYVAISKSESFRPVQSNVASCEPILTLHAVIELNGRIKRHALRNDIECVCDSREISCPGLNTWLYAAVSMSNGS